MCRDIYRASERVSYLFFQKKKNKILTVKVEIENRDDTIFKIKIHGTLKMLKALITMQAAECNETWDVPCLNQYQNDEIKVRDLLQRDDYEIYLEA